MSSNSNDDKPRKCFIVIKDIMGQSSTGIPQGGDLFLTKQEIHFIGYTDVPNPKTLVQQEVRLPWRLVESQEGLQRFTATE